MATNGTFLNSGLSVNQAGLVSIVVPLAHYRDPRLQLRWSDDGAHTWSNVYNVGLGLTGDYKKRAIWRRLGKSRNRVYEVVDNDPVWTVFVDAFVDADPQYKPQERLTDLLRKMA